jgi:hypothetical protein
MKDFVVVVESRSKNDFVKMKFDFLKPVFLFLVNAINCKNNPTNHGPSSHNKRFVSENLLYE